ncbi:MAG: efflux RND transporter periplasmic adaptor subunit [Polyangiaceae bacterium]|nr:efflux RND transporter periplasmic adaptor subunit [Polyangiaceae bacterium]
MTTSAQAPPLGDHGRPSPRGARQVQLIGVGMVLGAAATVTALLVFRSLEVAHQRTALEDRAARGLLVSVTRVETTAAHRSVTLPGDVRGYEQTTLYAKVSGYVRSISVERGQKVEKGELLAVIDSPETERDVESARRSAEIAHINAERADRLAPSGVVAAQDRDNAVANAHIATQGLGRAIAVQDYTNVRAPFEGVVSARYVDPGALVPAATGATQSAMPIVDLVRVDTLRIFVYVGQDVAPFVKTGDPVTITQDELPSRRIPSKVTYVSGALDVRTRTMQVETDLDNGPWQLQPGTLVHVVLQVQQDAPSPFVPDEAIVIRDGKTTVARVDGDRVHYVQVDLGFNDGRKVRVLRGLSGGETVAVDIPVEVQENDVIQPTLQPSRPTE